VVLSVIFRLHKYTPDTYTPKIEYGAIKEQLSNVDVITPKIVSDCIVSIRKSKLPDPEVI